MAEALRGKFTGVDLDSLVDQRLVKVWLYWGMFWLMLTPTVGVTISAMFNFPDYLPPALELTFGRLRPVHVNGVIFGAFSTLFIGLCYYLVPRLCGVRVWGEKLGMPLVWIWNIGLIAGLASLAMGWNQGLEAGEFPLAIDIVIFIIVTITTMQFLITIARRLEPQLYVALWYLISAFVWTVLNLILGSFIIPYTIAGINSAAFHGLFIHYIVGLWLTPAGYVVIYYFLPLSAHNPLYSHKLSLVGFWSLALFYPFVGIHHYLYSPIADWAETLSIITSMLLIIPVWTVLVNFFGTMNGSWQTFGTNLPAKFLIMGSIMYLFGCFQGSTEALRSIQQPTHFTDFVISHSHLTVFGTFVVWAIGGTGLCLAAAVRPRTLVVQARQLVVLADHRRHLDHGPGADRRRPAAGLCLDGGGRMARFDPAGPAVLAGAHPGRHLDGHRHVAAGAEPDADGAGQARLEAEGRQLLQAIAAPARSAAEAPE